MRGLFPDTEHVSPLFRIPIELRRHIYRYVLPSTSTFDFRLQRGSGEPERKEYNLTLVREVLGNEVWKMQQTHPKTDRETGHDVVWHRGSIGILAVNHQIHDECVDMVYGENVFVIDIAFDSIRFRYRWWLASSKLTPNRTYPFLDHFSQRNLLKIKNYIINVEHVDDYTGMIKFNCGGRGLTAGIRHQVQNLVELLAIVPQLNRVQLHLIDGEISRVRFPSGRVHRVQDKQNYSQSQTVLDPFMNLREVRRVQVTGVSSAYANSLQERMAAPRNSPVGNSVSLT